MRLRLRRFLAFTCCLGVITAIVFDFAFSAKAQLRAVTLRPGIVLDPNENVIYTMTPEGISAVDLQSGTKNWTTTAAAKPLAVSNNLLIGQVEPTDRSSRLELVTLDTRAGGSVRMRSVAQLPNSVRVAIGQTIEGRFETDARMLNNNAVVTWRFEGRPLKGKLEAETARPVAPRGVTNYCRKCYSGGTEFDTRRVSGRRDYWESKWRRSGVG
jgi:hypothetical protein